MKSLTITCLLCWNIYAQAQSSSTLIGARAAGMGYASTTLNDDYAIFNNIGGLSEIKTIRSVFSYESKRTLQGANRMAAAIIVPVKPAVAGISIFRFGDELYSEQIASAGFSNKFGITSLGIRANYIQYRTFGAETKNALSLNFGGITQITPQISVGAYIENINQARIPEKERIPTRLAAGFGIKPAENIFISTEIEKDIDYNASLKLGGEYSIKKKVFVRTGFNANPSIIHLGLGIRKERLSVDYAFSFSQFFGDTHQASAIYRIKREENKQ